MHFRKRLKIVMAVKLKAFKKTDLLIRPGCGIIRFMRSGADDALKGRFPSVMLQASQPSHPY